MWYFEEDVVLHLIELSGYIYYSQARIGSAIYMEGCEASLSGIVLKDGHISIIINDSIRLVDGSAHSDTTSSLRGISTSMFRTRACIA